MNATAFGRFDGRTVVVTGGASGIGLACAELLAERGARVVIIDRQAEGAQTVAERLGGVAYALDIAQVERVDELAARIEVEQGPVDALASVAGIVQAQAVPPQQIAWAQYNQIFEVNLRGTHAVCAAFGSRMARRGRGAIVNIASISAVRSTPLHAYGPMKAAIVSLTENLAGEWGRSGVRVNCLSPGAVLTPAMQASFDQGLRDWATMAQASATGKICLPREVAQAAAFLLSDEAGAITGVNLPVDHGWLVATSWQTFGGLRTAVSDSP
ncbi:MAG: SDR family oxidoreductase [Nitrosomonadaceae bacterium]|jgi:NAD(P)-dependent dehydrogenase (short-subunit alcohol dehydrogenase family)|nr:SDR family oxidoreductase [Nitrosomonadaceae bacterium]